MSEFPLLVDEPRCGIANMARDQALLECVAKGSLPGVLRFYQWEPATLSLGYFQPYASRAEHFPSLACPIVRRASGGGAIVHDRELTYSLALAAQHPLARDTAQLYRVVHQALCKVVGDLYQIVPTIWGEHQVLPSPQPKNVGGAEQTGATMPFLCFMRRSPGDVVLANPKDSPLGGELRLTAESHPGQSERALARGSKILGSAQRRREGAVLQHGSLLLGQSKYAPELPGLMELSGHTLAISDLTEAWSLELQAALGLSGYLPGNTPAAYDTAYGAAWEKFAAQSWLQTR